MPNSYSSSRRPVPYILDLGNDATPGYSDTRHAETLSVALKISQTITLCLRPGPGEKPKQSDVDTIHETVSTKAGQQKTDLRYMGSSIGISGVEAHYLFKCPQSPLSSFATVVDVLRPDRRSITDSPLEANGLNRNKVGRPSTLYGSGSGNIRPHSAATDFLNNGRLNYLWVLIYFLRIRPSELLEIEILWEQGADNKTILYLPAKQHRLVSQYLIVGPLNNGM